MNKLNSFMNKQMELCFNQKKKQKNKTKNKKKRECVTFIFDPLVKSLNSKRRMLQYRLHCSCFILFFSVHTFLFMFHYYFLQSTFPCSCFIVISFSPQSIPFTYHISLIWLYSCYMVIQPHGQFHFSANPFSGN